MTNVVKFKRRPRPLKATYYPSEPFQVIREDEDDGSITYMVYDMRPVSYRFICLANDEGGTDPNAKLDMELVARSLNFYAQYQGGRVK